MARAVNDSILEYIQENIDLRPILIVGINWGGGTNWFSSRKVEGMRDNILQASQCSCSKRSDNQSTSGSMSITFDDSDGWMKYIIDHTLTEKAPATVFIGFEEIGEKIPILQGQVTSPVAWDEGDRSLSLNIEAIVESREAGFTPTDEYPDIDDSAKGAPWPMVFGTCANIPTIKVRTHRQGVLLADVTLSSQVYKFNSTSRVFTFDDECTAFSWGPSGYETGVIYVENGEKFPQAETIQISINGVIFEGQFDDAIFTVSKANVPRYETIAFGPRDMTDDDHLAPHVAWLPIDSKVNIEGHHVYLTHSTNKPWYNFCVAQQGNKCWFSAPFISPQSALEFETGKYFIFIDARHTIKRAYYGAAENGLLGEWCQQMYAWFISYQYEIKNPQYPVPTTLATTKKRNGTLAHLLDGLKSKAESFWSESAGTEVFLWNKDDPDIYVASCIPLTEVSAVYGKRVIDKIQGQQVKVFCQIPESYYEVQLTSNFEVNGSRASALLFHTPLSEYVEELWDDEVFVTGTSSIGPNVADIIRFLLTNYTDLHIGSRWTGSSDPVNFVVFQSPNALQLAQDIAWQARCALRLDSEEAELLFLPHQPISVFTFNESNVDRNSLELGFTPTTEITTKLIAKWTTTYRSRTSPNAMTHVYGLTFADVVRSKRTIHKHDEQVSVYRNNIDKFGEVPKDINIQIYNEEEYVRKTLDFWGFRYSNSWRVVKFRTYLSGIILQPFDLVTLDFTIPVLANLGGVPALVESVSYDNGITTVEAWIPSVAGSFSILNAQVWNNA